MAGDFDGDGFADIYAVQNSYAPIPAVGRYDGGLSQLLRGDGHGQFVAVPVAQSNLVVIGDAKALAVLDLDHDGWPDFLDLARNNATTLAFRNQPVAGPALAGDPVARPPAIPPPSAPGSCVTLADGTTQSAEVFAGSGYYSQSTATCFFGWPDTNPPKALHVRWPSGITTKHLVPAGSSGITLSQPTP